MNQTFEQAQQQHDNAEPLDTEDLEERAEEEENNRADYYYERAKARE